MWLVRSPALKAILGPFLKSFSFIRILELPDFNRD